MSSWNPNQRYSSTVGSICVVPAQAPPHTSRLTENRLNLKSIYTSRFSRTDSERKDAIWRQLGGWLQRFIPADARVLDIACDRGDFIRNIRAGERWASDVRDVSEYLPADVHFVPSSGLDLDSVLDAGYFDVAFMSNYLEHLPSMEAVVQQLEVAHRLLRQGGRVVILQPNIRLIGGSYWDFVDHQVALTDRSLAEAAILAGFETEQVIPRFLPYTTKSRLPQHPLLVRAYLAFPPAWLVMGKQSLFVGKHP